MLMSWSGPKRFTDAVVELREVKSIPTKYIGFYFSAHWCPPCRQFTPQLIAAYGQLLQHKMEIVFVSSDTNQIQFADYFATMPWLAIKYTDGETREALSAHFGVSSIPTLVIVEAKSGQVVTKQGRDCVLQSLYPWDKGFSSETVENKGKRGWWKRMLAMVFAVVLTVIATPVGDLVPCIRGTMPTNHLLSQYGFTEEEIPNLADKTFLVTGANSGVGFGTTKVLLRHGANVLMACRSQTKCQAALQALESSKIQASQTLECLQVNLSSLKDVHRFGKQFAESGTKLDSLILNAGIMFTPHELTEDGIESQWAVNHVAHFLLTKLLLPSMKSKSTIVSVASNLHFLASLDWSLLSGRGVENISDFSNPVTSNRFLQYGRAKLANILFAKELARRLEQQHGGILVNSLHPGGVQSELARSLPWWIYNQAKFAQDLLFWTEEKAALTVIACAWNDKLFQQHVTGQYFVPVGRLDHGSGLAQNQTLAQAWYEQTEQLLAEKGFT
ncbi:hypothetical protein BASA82_000584 [Batrachochytrium salamandrivorans]|nr:hypothetical protein BASA82_000584 [Batrachochytrium salamandrivorans]